MASPPIEATVEIVGEFVAAELHRGPGLVDVFTSPDVRAGVRFEGNHDPYGGEGVVGVFEGVQGGPFCVGEVGEDFPVCLAMTGD